jgi:glycosyltransferase involved in cell wall biosynthesis
MSKTIRRVILCADGDSQDIDLWSNIPFLLGQELERRGIELVRVNLAQPLWIKRLWRYTLGPRHRLRHWSTSIDFYRSATNHWLTTRRLNQAIRRHGGPGALLINLSISAAPTEATIPVVLLSDWSYHHYITERLGRPPDGSERATIARDTAAMLRASLVVLLFPESAARLQRQIPAGRFRFLGHVINDHPLAMPPPLEPPAAFPHRPWRLLFIGRPRYREGLQLLLRALPLLPKDVPVHLDAIGMTACDGDPMPRGPHQVVCHDYLSKANAEQRELYYSLLNDADLIVNASAAWGGFSATVEAMHRRTAVLTPPYGEFQSLFGELLPFGSYLCELSADAVATSMASLLRQPARLAARQQAAHRAVQGMTWMAFVDNLLKEIPDSPCWQKS